MLLCVSVCRCECTSGKDFLSRLCLGPVGPSWLFFGGGEEAAPAVRALGMQISLSGPSFPGVLKNYADFTGTDYVCMDVSVFSCALLQYLHLTLSGAHMRTL